VVEQIHQALVDVVSAAPEQEISGWNSDNRCSSMESNRLVIRLGEEFDDLQESEAHRLVAEHIQNQVDDEPGAVVKAALLRPLPLVEDGCVKRNDSELCCT
jgi:hypothetical protein